MYEQPGMPADPYGNVPPVPPAPPGPPGVPPVVPPGYAPGPYGPYGPPPPPPRPSRAWVWVTVGVAGGALLVGAGAYALSGVGDAGGGGTAQVTNAAPATRSSGTGAAGGDQRKPASASGSGGSGATSSGGGGATQPLKRFQLPAAFQGLTRNDTFAGTAELQRIAQNAAPEAEVNVTAYLGGQFGERHAIIVAASVPRPITEAERQSDTAAAFRPNPMSENKTVYGPVQSLAGGTIQCATAITKLSQPDALGGTMYSNVQCISIGYNTELELNESEVLSGMSLVKVADDLARFRSVAEVPR